MGKNLKNSIIFKVKYFGPLIGIAVALLILFISQTTPIFTSLELKMLDIHFRWKNISTGKKVKEGVTRIEQNEKISRDIVIIGIDADTLKDFGKWPFPRYRHSELLDSFSRISDQNQRESSIFLDIFFIEKESKPYSDALLVDSIKNNGHVLLETVLKLRPPQSSRAEEIYSRQKALFEQCGDITQVYNSSDAITTYYGVDPPLFPFSASTNSYGHANFYEDSDEVYRRQQLIAKYSVLMETIEIENLSTSFTIDQNNHERLAWEDNHGKTHTVEYPLTDQILMDLKRDLLSKAPPKEEDTDGDGKPDVEKFFVKKYQDHFIPAITLALAINYFNSDFEDVIVTFGKDILIPDPKIRDTNTGELIPYKLAGKIVPEIRIPINEEGEMVINYMGKRSNATRGGYQTYPVRGYSAYSKRVPTEDKETWPKTKGVANKILMVGAFAQGMADDEKTTPFGLMYGIEIHANALNTILMNNFIIPIPVWIQISILFGLSILVSFYSSRINTGWSLVLTIVLLLVLFFTVTTLFDTKNLLFDFATPVGAIALTFISIVVYRVFMEESDKKRIKSMFGKYVSPVVVDQMMDKPPELGGEDSDVTVFFSDIRSFTTLSESMSPQELVELLNEYLTSMTDTLINFNGTLDKYIGDAIMCFWGAPLAQEDHAILSCKCALKQFELLNELNKNWPETKQIRIGIGLNSGICTVGNMGSAGRMNYTAMGDNVNLASRLEGINKQYHTEIIISEYTYEKIKNEGFICRELDDIRVKGKRQPVRIYELLGFEGPIEIPAK